MKFIAIRTEMIGGGTSYDVYVPLTEISKRPLYIICHGGIENEYAIVTDALLPANFDSLPSCSEIRWNTYKDTELRAKEIELQVAKIAYPELSNFDRLPVLWTGYTLPTDEKFIEFNV